jgi:hypothetical protein
MCAMYKVKKKLNLSGKENYSATLSDIMGPILISILELGLSQPTYKVRIVSTNEFRLKLVMVRSETW